MLPLLLPLGLGVQGVVASLGLGLKPARTAADVGDRAAAEVSPENLSETRVMAVTGWWGCRKERLKGRGLEGPGVGKVCATSVGLSPGPAMWDQQESSAAMATSSGKASIPTLDSLASPGAVFLQPELPLPSLRGSCYNQYQLVWYSSTHPF